MFKAFLKFIEGYPLEPGADSCPPDSDDEHFLSRSSALDDSYSSNPATNVDGTPMVADTGIDIHGNPYGIVD